MSRRETEEDDRARIADEELSAELEESEGELSGAEELEDESGATGDAESPTTAAESARADTEETPGKEELDRVSAEEELAGISEEEELRGASKEELETVSDDEGATPLDELSLADEPGTAEDETSWMEEELETPTDADDKDASEEMPSDDSAESAERDSSSNSANKSRTCAKDGVEKRETKKTRAKKRIGKIYKKSRSKKNGFSSQEKINRP